MYEESKDHSVSLSHKRKGSNSTWLKISFIALGFIICFVVGLLSYKLLDSNSEIAQEKSTLESTNDFPAYYPLNLPKGFVFNNSSVSHGKNVIAYTVDYNNGKKLFVSVQPRPEDAVIDNFHNNLMSNTIETKSPVGKAYIGQVRGAISGSILAEKSWIIISAPQGIDEERMSEVIKSITSPTKNNPV